MPLTRHLYAEDEVVAALQFCVLRGRAIEAAFWCEELLYSEMVEPLFVGLRRIWLYGFGIGALSWYREFERVAAQDEIDMEEIVGLVVGLCRIGSKGRRDNTYLVLSGSTAGAEQAGFCIGPKGLAGADAYFVHSFEMRPASADYLLATCDYGGTITAAIGRGNIVGTQFHPEKSQAMGLVLLGNFLKWRP